MWQIGDRKSEYLLTSWARARALSIIFSSLIKSHFVKIISRFSFLSLISFKNSISGSPIPPLRSTSQKILQSLEKKKINFKKDKWYLLIKEDIFSIKIKLIVFLRFFYLDDSFEYFFTKFTNFLALFPLTPRFPYPGASTTLCILLRNSK